MIRRELYPDPDTEPRDPTVEDQDRRDNLADIAREDRIERERLDRLEAERESRKDIDDET